MMHQYDPEELHETAMVIAAIVIIVAVAGLLIYGELP